MMPATQSCRIPQLSKFTAPAAGGKCHTGWKVQEPFLYTSQERTEITKQHVLFSLFPVAITHKLWISQQETPFPNAFLNKGILAVG